MLSFIRRQAPTGFDDKAELQEFEQTALKPTLTIACRHWWWLIGMQRLLPFTTDSSLVAQCPSEQKLFVAKFFLTQVHYLARDH